MLRLISLLRTIARWTYIPTSNRLFDPISGTAILISLAIGAATTAAAVGLEYLVAKGRKVPPVDRGKLDDVRVSVPGYGEPIVRGYGVFRCAPIWFWHAPIAHSTSETPGRPGGKGTPKPPTPATIDHIYTTSLGGVICEGEITEVRRIWFDTDLVYNMVTTGSHPISASKYEAEDATLGGGANAVSSSECSNGQRVQGIGSGGSVEFSVTVTASGSYEIGIYYTSTITRAFKVSLNGGANIDVICNASGGVNVVAIQTLTLSLNNGANTILFTNSGAAAPDLDKIEVVNALTLDPDDPVDRRRFTGLVNPNLTAPSDQDLSWTYYNDRPEADANGTTSTNLAKYGQPSLRTYTGTETQTADPAIIADKGASNAPAYRGVAYLVIEGLQLPAGRLPNVTVEVDQGTTNVATINEDLYELVGVGSSNLTLTAISGDTLTGFVIPSRKAAGEAIADLQTRFQYDLPEVDGKVKAVKRNGSSDLTISYTELRAHLDGEEMPAFDALITDIDPLLLPKRVDVNYQDPELDFHNNTQSDMRLTGPQYDEQTISLSIIDSADNAKKLASTLLYRPEMEGRSFKFTTGPKYMKLHPGSVATLTLPNTTHVVRITEAKYQLPAGVCEFEGVRQQASIYDPTGTGSISTGYEAPIAPIPSNTKGVIIDGPLLRPEDAGDGTQPVVYVGACGRGAGAWQGGFLYQEYPIDSDNYVFVTAFDKPSTIGVTSGALATVSDPTVFDRTNTLTVKFFSNTVLQSVTEDELLTNPELNLLAVKNPSTEAVEYLQFKTAIADVASAPYFSQYTVSTLLRGRMGTEHNVSDHSSADDVMLMDANVKPRRLDINQLGRELKFKFVSSGQAEEDAQVYELTLNGNSLKAYATTDHRGTRDSGSDLLIEFNGRTRIAGGLRVFQAAAVNEESELYKVQILDGSGNATLPNTNEERILTIVPAQKVPLAAFLVSSYSGFVGISHNTLEGEFAGGDTFFRSARSVQLVHQSENFIEAALHKDTQIGGVVAVGLQVEGGEWKSLASELSPLIDEDTLTGTLVTYPYIVRLESTGGTFYQVFSVYEYGERMVRATDDPGDPDYDPNFGWITDINDFALFRVRFNFIGSSVRIQKAHTAAVPFTTVFTGTRNTVFPLFGVAAATASTNNKVMGMFMTCWPFAKTIYSSSQQEKDFGSVQPSIQMDIWQHSRLSGDGPKTRVTL